VQRLRKHPLTRMLRVGKLTDMALEHTLRLFLQPDLLIRTHPTLRMLTLQPTALKRKAARLQREVRKKAPSLQTRVGADKSSVGGGALPGVPLPTFVLAVRAPNLPAKRIAQLLRRREAPVIARIQDDEVLLDMRTLLDGEETIIRDALLEVGRAAGKGQP
jgi:L-seryl-tRNA(Ser) seleniumtransferase